MPRQKKKTTNADSGTTTRSANLTEGEVLAAHRLVENHVVDKDKARASMTRLIRYALCLEDKSTAADIVKFVCYAWDDVDIIMSEQNNKQ